MHGSCTRSTFFFFSLRCHLTKGPSLSLTSHESVKTTSATKPFTFPLKKGRISRSSLMQLLVILSCGCHTSSAPALGWCHQPPWGCKRSPWSRHWGAELQPQAVHLHSLSELPRALTSAGASLPELLTPTSTPWLREGAAGNWEQLHTTELLPSPARSPHDHRPHTHLLVQPQPALPKGFGVLPAALGLTRSSNHLKPCHRPFP